MVLDIWCWCVHVEFSAQCVQTLCVLGVRGRCVGIWWLREITLYLVVCRYYVFGGVRAYKMFVDGVLFGMWGWRVGRI